MLAFSLLPYASNHPITKLQQESWQLVAEMCSNDWLGRSFPKFFCTSWLEHRQESVSAWKNNITPSYSTCEITYVVEFSPSHRLEWGSSGSQVRNLQLQSKEKAQRVGRWSLQWNIYCTVLHSQVSDKCWAQAEAGLPQMYFCMYTVVSSHERSCSTKVACQEYLLVQCFKHPLSWFVSLVLTTSCVSASGFICQQFRYKSFYYATNFVQDEARKSIIKTIYTDDNVPCILHEDLELSFQYATQPVRSEVYDKPIFQRYFEIYMLGTNLFKASEALPPLCDYIRLHNRLFDFFE